MTIAVTGASGQLGRIVVEKLKNKVSSSEIIALARSREKASGLGVAVREADYEQPETLQKAFAGVETLLLISSSEIGRRVAQHNSVIEAAKNAGVRRIAYTSLLRADTSTLSLAEEHRQTEAALKASGIAVTILRNGWYTENNTGSIGGVLASGVLIGGAGDGKISSAPRSDYAEAAAVALTGAGHEGQIYELAGDQAWCLADLAAEISRQAGRTIPYKNLSEADYAAALAGLGMDKNLAAAIAGWDADASQGVLFDDSKQLSRLIGRPTVPLAETVAEAIRGLA